ncbi:MAG: ABC transporter ATP-binding protein, partial [bacterium]|nr:ABC transporter ATP-binding protein [bacterium]
MFTKLNLTPVQHPDRMAEYWKKEWKTILIVIISGLIFDGSMSLIPVFQGKLMDTVIYDRTWNAMIHQAFLFVALVVVIQTFRGIKRFSVRVFANQTGAVMRRIIYNNILHRSYDELVKETAGDLMNKAVNDVDLCVEGMRKVTTEVFDTGVLMTGYMISLFLYDWKMTIAACILIPAAMFIAERLKVIVVRFNKEARKQSSTVAELTYSNIEHIKLYRITGTMADRKAQYEDELKSLEKASVRANVIETSMQPIYNAISMLGIGVILYIGGMKVIGDVWSIGTFTAYIAIFTALGTKASKAAKLFNSFQKATVSWKRLKPYCTGYRTMDETDNLTDMDELGKVPYQIVCSHVSFGYEDAEEELLHDITFSVQTGEIVGVTGPVACGKTTLGRVLTGVYHYDGDILLNGVQLSSMTEYQRSRRISYEGHHSELFSDTIYRNITLGDDGDITQVLKDVCFDVDLQTMENGTETLVGNGGVRLSGGQQSRIALARALWHRAPLIILDDPFSAVDMETEKRIIENLHAHYQDCAFVLVSHRLAAFPGLDRVIYLNQGRAEIGTH